MKRTDVAPRLLPSLLLLTALLLAGPSRAQRPPRCSDGLVVDCIPGYEDVVWNRDGDGNCRLAVNRCRFDIHNCYRYRQGQALLVEVPKDECQRLCRSECPAPAERSRVCAQRGSRFCYFGNECLREKYVCNTGQIWSPSLNRFCDGSEGKGRCPDLQQ